VTGITGMGGLPLGFPVGFLGMLPSVLEFDYDV